MNTVEGDEILGRRSGEDSHIGLDTLLRCMGFECSCVREEDGCQRRFRSVNDTSIARCTTDPPVLIQAPTVMSVVGPTSGDLYVIHAPPVT